MKKYADLIKRSVAYNMLLGDVKKNSLSHAYLLLSEDRLSLDLLAELFLQAAVGGEDNAFRSQAVEAGTLADIISLPESGDKVTVKDINFLTETVYITPTELKKKFYVINYGETMNEASQNKLLKTLEEPPGVSVIIIKAAGAEKLLPTVKSRCRKVELAPYTETELKRELSKYYPDDEKLFLAVNAGRGSLQRAVDFVSQPQNIKLLKLAEEILTQLDKSGGIAEFAFKLYDYRDSLSDIIDFIELILMSSVKINCGAASAGDFPYDVAAVARRYPTNAALKETEVLTRARKRLALNGNATAVIDELLFSILEVRAKWK